MGINPQDIPAVMERLLPIPTIHGLAKTSNLVKRKRKLNPVFLIWTLVLSFGVQIERRLSRIKRAYEVNANTHLSDGSWYDWFTPNLVRFVKECTLTALQNMAKETHGTLSPKLKRFDDILIQDSTIIRVHESLAKRWPATRSRRDRKSTRLNSSHYRSSRMPSSA